MQQVAASLIEVGPVLSNDMGQSCITWSELLSWQIVTDSLLNVFELGILRQASSEYLNCINEYREKTVNEPYCRILTKEEKEQEYADIAKKEEAFYDMKWGDGKEEDT